MSVEYRQAASFRDLSPLRHGHQSASLCRYKIAINFKSILKAEVMWCKRCRWYFRLWLRKTVSSSDHRCNSVLCSNSNMWCVSADCFHHMSLSEKSNKSLLS